MSTNCLDNSPKTMAPTESVAKMTKSDVEVKFVTIGGKEVEVKYETQRNKYDIFGLHARDRRNGSNNNNNNINNSNHFQKSGNSDSFKRNNFNKNIRIIGQKKRNLLNDKHNENSNSNRIVSNNSSNNSIDSKEMATNGSAKVDKAIRRLQSGEGLQKKSDLSVERIANRIAKEKEPVKMWNRFDTLLSTNEEILPLQAGVTSDSNSAKKNRKKKNKSKFEDNLFVINNKIDDSPIDSDTSSANIVAQQELIPQTVGTVYNIGTNDKNFRENDYLNNNYYNKSVENVEKVINNKIEDIESQPILELNNNNNNNIESIDYLVTKVTTEEPEVEDWPNRTEPTISWNKEESEEVSNRTDDTIAPIVRKREKFKSLNGESIVKKKRFVDKKFKTKSQTFEPNISKVFNDSSIVEQNNKQSFFNWFLIIVGILAFLSIYTVLIQYLFCKC